jgi:prephenate dehydrogenase
MERVAIVGLGLIGGSLGLALRAKLPEVDVIGVARRDATARLAEDLGAVGRASTSLSAIGDADLVVLACPLGVTNQVLDDCVPHLAEGARVTDVGSVKGPVVKHAHAGLDAGRNLFLGGHPMAGKEVSGLEHAEAGLFEGCTWALTPHAGDKTPPAFADLVDAIGRIGAHALVVRPADHDWYVALVSHIPFLLSAAYLNAAGAGEGWESAALLASSGFRDISRLGAGNSEMYTAITEYNREAVLDAWAQLHTSLDQFEAAITREDASALLDLFVAARKVRDDWLSRRPHPDPRG